MVKCPECEGDMIWDWRLKQYACLKCGLSLTYEEILKLREAMKPQETEEERRKRAHREYLKWWLSKKK